LHVQANQESKHEQTLRHGLDARFRIPLMNYFYRRTGDRAAAEDLTQETFLRLLGSNSFVQADQANAFVFRVASNLLADRRRQSARRPSHIGVSPGDCSNERLEIEMAEEPGPERALIAKESLHEVLALLNQLDERTRDIFMLFRLEGMKQKEIASLYGMGLSTVEKCVIRAALHLAGRFRRPP
jgi:RNA polymerase sigma factor (sigma-70 family)